MNRAFLLALLATGCATHAPPRFADRPPPGGRDDRHGPAGRLFVSPVGEPFRSDQGDPERAWFDGVDTDHDGRLTQAEMRVDALRFFAMLDTDTDGEIDPAEIDRYETILLPELRVADGGGRQGGPPGARRGGAPGGGRGPGGGGPGGGGPGGGGPGGGGRGGPDDGDRRSAPSAAPMRQGAGRYAYLDLPEPVTSADRNLNRGIDREELARAAADRFVRLDVNHDGALTRAELPRVDTRAGGRHEPPPGAPPRRPTADEAPTE